MLQAISRLPGTTTKQGHKLQVSQDSKAQATLWLPFTTTSQMEFTDNRPFLGGSIAHLPFVSVHCIVVSTGAMGMDYELAPSRD